jgi:hypothetical protein
LWLLRRKNGKAAVACGVLASCEGGGMQGYTQGNWYFVGNGATGQCVDVVARSKEAACRNVGWVRRDCVVIRVGQAPVTQPLQLLARRQGQRARHVDQRLRRL